MTSMDSTNAASSSIPSCKQKSLDVDEEAKPLSKRDEFYSTYRCHQNFALPDSIMFYVIKNPATPKGYQTIIKTCKYFFAKNPINIHAELFYNGKGWRAKVNGTWEGYINDSSKFTSKLWVTNDFFVSGASTSKHNLVSTAVPKLYRYEAKKLGICDQIVSYNDFLYLASTAERIYLRADVTVKHDDGCVLSLEDIFAASAKCKKFLVFPFNNTLTNITSNTLKELLKLSHFWKLKSFCLSNIPDTFNLDDFCDYMKKNKVTNVKLHFDDSVSAAYKQRLEAIIDEILQTEVFDYKSPLLSFFGLDYAKYRKLHNIYSSH